MKNVTIHTEEEYNTDNKPNLLPGCPRIKSELPERNNSKIDAECTKMEDTISHTDQCKHFFSNNENVQEPNKENNFANDFKPKKLPKVLSKLCLGPGSDEAVFGPIIHSKTKNAENCESCGSSRESLITENKKSNRKSIKNKIGENIKYSIQPISSKEIAKNSLLSENEDKRHSFLEKRKSSPAEEQAGYDIDSSDKDSESENKKTQENKFTLTRTPKMLKKIFLTKSDDTVESSKTKRDSLYDESNITNCRNSIKNDYIYSDEDVELRIKPGTRLKRTLRESFRNSFRVKRTLSEPAKEKSFEIKPRRSNTFKIFSKALLQTAAVKMNTNHKRSCLNSSTDDVQSAERYSAGDDFIL